MSYQTGNAIRMTFTFRDFDDVVTEPDAGSIVLTFYDAVFTQVAQFVQAQLTKIADGEWKFYYVPSTEGTFTYEIKAMIAGLPSLRRVAVEIVRV